MDSVVIQMFDNKSIFFLIIDIDQQISDSKVREILCCGAACVRCVKTIQQQFFSHNRYDFLDFELLSTEYRWKYK